jgi:undecaprenyl phosphate N,N'-diacetylbacillosamine 1-phosphate transferase
LKRRFQLGAKRAFDLVFAAVGLLMLLPAFVGVAIAIILDSPGPVLFKLRVAGRNGRVFDALKFRTMIKDAREKAHPFETFSADPRITRVGRFLRRWSLDELPQLWNVLRGEMSLVGPRPMFLEVASRYPEREARRLQMRPGITGLAQVSGRNSISWNERVELDLAYIDRYSLWLDLKVLLATLPVVLTGEGVYGPDGRVRMHDLA